MPTTIITLKPKNAFYRATVPMGLIIAKINPFASFLKGAVWFVSF